MARLLPKSESRNPLRMRSFKQSFHKPKERDARRSGRNMGASNAPRISIREGLRIRETHGRTDGAHHALDAGAHRTKPHPARRERFTLLKLAALSHPPLRISPRRIVGTFAAVGMRRRGFTGPIFSGLRGISPAS